MQSHAADGKEIVAELPADLRELIDNELSQQEALLLFPGNEHWKAITGDQLALYLAQKLPSNTSVTSLNLGFLGDRMSPLGVKAIADALNHNRRIKRLSLDADGIGGLMPVIEMLKQNRGLQELELGTNSAVGYRAWECLGLAMKHNDTLRKLTLKNLDWGPGMELLPQGLEEFAEGLKENEALTVLDLNGHDIEDWRSFLIDALETKNSSLVEIRCADTADPAGEQQRLFGYLRENREAPDEAGQRARCLMFCCTYLHQIGRGGLGVTDPQDSEEFTRRVLRPLFHNSASLSVARRFVARRSTFPTGSIGATFASAAFSMASAAFSLVSAPFRARTASQAELDDDADPQDGRPTSRRRIV